MDTLEEIVELLNYRSQLGWIVSEHSVIDGIRELIEIIDKLEERLEDIEKILP